MTSLTLRNAFMGAVLSQSIFACASSPPAAIDGHISIDRLIDRGSASHIIQDIRNESDRNSVMTVEISSVGGSVTRGYRIIDELNSSGNDYVLNCNGPAYSMAAIILISASGQNRNATDNCEVMIHEPFIDIKDPNNRNITIARTVFAALYPNYQAALSDTNLNEVTITHPSHEPYSLSRQRLLRYVEIIHGDREAFKERLSATSRLTSNDVEIMFRSGDVYFSTPYEAAFAGLIDTINGEQPNSARVRAAGRDFCADAPEGLSICR